MSLPSPSHVVIRYMRVKGKTHWIAEDKCGLYTHAFEALDIPFLCHPSFPSTVPPDLKHVLKCYHPLRFQDVSEATKGLL